MKIGYRFLVTIVPAVSVSWAGLKAVWAEELPPLPESIAGAGTVIPLQQVAREAGRVASSKSESLPPLPGTVAPAPAATPASEPLPPLPGNLTGPNPTEPTASAVYATRQAPNFYQRRGNRALAQLCCRFEGTGWAESHGFLGGASPQAAAQSPYEMGGAPGYGGMAGPGPMPGAEGAPGGMPGAAPMAG